MDSYNFTNSVKVTNLAPNILPSVVWELFSFLGQLKTVDLYQSMTLENSMDAVVEYVDGISPKVALHLTGTELGEKMLVVTPLTAQNLAMMLATNHDTSKTLHLSNLTLETAQTDIQEALHPFGPVEQVKMGGDSTFPTRFAFVQFADCESADKVLNLTELEIKGNQIKVQRAKQPIRGKDNVMAVQATGSIVPIIPGSRPRYRSRDRRYRTNDRSPSPDRRKSPDPRRSPPRRYRSPPRRYDDRRRDYRDSREGRDSRDYRDSRDSRDYRDDRRPYRAYSPKDARDGYRSPRDLPRGRSDLPA
jgi:arginine/serine-rich splicing factor 12